MKVVCATRGGQGSRIVREYAIQFAQKNNALLQFVYIIDLDRLNPQHKLLEAIREELSFLGRALLELAYAGAQKKNVRTEKILLEGRLEETLCTYLKGNQIDRLFLGAPRGVTSDVIGDDEIEQFAARIQEKTAVIVEIVYSTTGAQ